MRLKILAHARTSQVGEPACRQRQQHGLSLVELLAALGIAALIFAALAGVITQALETERVVRSHNDLHQQAGFAMQQMVQAVSHSQRLMLPLGENPATAWSESIRDPGVLAVTLDPTLDRDKDGWADANNDKDYLDRNNNGTRNTGEPERIDEDFWHDITNDGASGLIGIDDDNDGLIDESTVSDDDEDGMENEDGMGNGDEDGDGAMDEDMSFETSKDNAPGILNVDDDYDGTVDEGFKDDDDEDGSQSEDWYDPVVFYLSGTTLLQRIPDINPTSGSDYTEYPIADNVSRFRVERIAEGAGRAVLVELSLILTDTDGESAELSTRIRIGGSL